MVGLGGAVGPIDLVFDPICAQTAGCIDALKLVNARREEILRLCGLIDDLRDSINDLVDLINKLKKLALVFVALAVAAAIVAVLTCSWNPFACGAAIGSIVFCLLIAAILFAVAYVLGKALGKLNSRLKDLLSDKANLQATLTQAGNNALAICPPACHKYVDSSPPC